jgi:hypothetical protein
MVEVKGSTNDDRITVVGNGGYAVPGNERGFLRKVTREHPGFKLQKAKNKDIGIH